MPTKKPWLGDPVLYRGQRLSSQPWTVKPHQVRDLAFIWEEVVCCAICKHVVAEGDRVRWRAVGELVHVCCERGEV